jgi:bifunctional non-homologous end joining protein LigD
VPSRNLKTYRDKRLADATPEPFGRALVPATGKLFVVQQHKASHLHFDLRLEMDGVLRSWAVPKGPSPNQKDKRFAALVEDHPLDYANFEGTIPEGNYGAGQVIVWDRGIWQPVGDPKDGLKKGKLLFDLHGFKLHGRWTLVRMKGGRSPSKAAEEGREWLFIKERDRYEGDDGTFSDRSVLSGLTVAELAEPAAVSRRRLAAARRLKETVPVAKPPSISPMLATAGEAFDHADWLFELKYDGYRIMIDKKPNEIVLRSRNGHDLTARFPEIARSAERILPERYVMDGELVVLNAAGVPDFSLLQTRAKLSGELEVARAAIEMPCTYFAFDLLSVGDDKDNGFDLRLVPLSKRKQQLQKLLPPQGAIRYSEHVLKDGRSTYQAAVQLGLEGMVGKRRNSRYEAGRSQAWIKVRHAKTADFVILGTAANRNNSKDIGSLALGEYRRGVLTYVGRAGSGLNAEMRRALENTSMASVKRPEFVPADQAKKVSWVKPTLAVEVAFKEYTRDGHLRHPVIQRLRQDKSIDECIGGFDDPGVVTLEPAPEPIVAITHPDKIFFPERELTKLDLIRYYERISQWMLPYLADRPIVLTRYPDGIHGKSFYQRDAPDFVPEWIRREVLWSESAEREVRYFIVEGAAALKYLANLGTIPIHTAHSRVANLEHPDWCVLDLDPKSAPFADVITLAQAIGALADELDLPAYPKTSGKSGLHVVIPLARQLSHDHARTLAELMARVIVARYPEISTVARSLRAREGKVYVDFGQNGQGRLLVAPFSVRAEPAASVSMPLKWSEVNGRLDNTNYHISNAIRRMQRLGEDPLAGVLIDQPDLVRALSQLAEISS